MSIKVIHKTIVERMTESIIVGDHTSAAPLSCAIDYALKENSHERGEVTFTKTEVEYLKLILRDAGKFTEKQFQLMAFNGVNVERRKIAQDNVLQKLGLF